LADVMPCWASGSQCLTDHSAFIFTVRHPNSNCLTLKEEALQSFKMSWTIHPATQHHIARDQQHCFVNLMSCLFLTAVIFIATYMTHSCPYTQVCWCVWHYGLQRTTW